MSTLRKGFTLVEILIVVVILGILAAIVVPQFASASQDAIKSALRSQTQTISAQIELYRVQNAGTLPHDAGIAAGDGGPVGGAAHNGWGILVEQSFLKDEPNNGFTRSSDVTVVAAGAGVGDDIAGDLAAAASPASDGSTTGWLYNPDLGAVHPNGVDFETDGGPFFSNETGFVAPVW